MAAEKILCPSSVCIEGAGLLGIVNSEGMVDILPEPIPIDADFVVATQEGRPAEERFRFTNICVKKECHQWSDNQCGIVERVQQFIHIEEQLQQLPACGIRSRCRWYLQHGASACNVCVYIVKDAPLVP
jgi:hypothetical protein